MFPDQQATSHREENKKLKAFALKLKKELGEMKEKVCRLLAWADSCIILAQILASGTSVEEAT